MFFFFMDPVEVARYQGACFPHLTKVEEFVEVARAADATMSIGTLAAFVRVARLIPQLAANELTLRDIAEMMDVPYTSFVRQVDLLCEGTAAVRGLNLLEKGVHPEDRRARQVRLTKKGGQLLHRLCLCMGPTRGTNGQIQPKPNDTRRAVSVARRNRAVSKHRHPTAGK